MAVRDLSQRDQSLILRCLRFILYERRFDQGDAETRLGVTVEDLRELERTWPADDVDAQGVAFIAINNVLNEVCHGPEVPTADEWISVLEASLEEASAVYARWARSHGLSWTGVR